MSAVRSVGSMFMMAMLILGANVASSQDYPNKPIRILNSTAGGGTDIVSRQIAQDMSGPLGQPVIVENHAGVTPSIVLTAKAAPDGYTILVAGSTLWTQPLLQKNPVWDPVKDFSPITFATATPSILIVTPSLPVKSVKELIALAKARPGALNCGVSGPGSASHLASELFKFVAGINVVMINYSGNVPATLAVATGEMQMTIGGSSAVDAVKAGRVRALAVASTKPSALFPGLPTIAATLPGYEAQAVNAVLAPAKTPAAIIRRLNQEIVRSLSAPEVKARFLARGMEIDTNTPEQFAASIKAEMTLMGNMIKKAGVPLMEN